MNRSLLATIGLLGSSFLSGAPADDQPGRLEVSVLYAGVPGSPRTKEFAAFLGESVSKVGTADVATLTADAARAYDVVIVDSPSPYKGDKGFEMPKVAKLGLDFTKPTILIGAAGGQVLNGLNIKLGWL